MEQIIKKYINPSVEEWPALCQRRLADDDSIAQRVADIIALVKEKGDEAIRALSMQIDGVALDTIEVSSRELKGAYEKIAPELREAIAEAVRNITRFHMAQRFEPVRVETMPGVLCVQRAVPIERVGLYIPGGTAPLFSTVLMLAIPAKVAGCKEIILCTPPDKQGSIAPAVLFAAMVCGVEKIYKVGGAQAIAAMTYGTATIPAVDKIFGPGNRYVTKAKEMLSSTVAIDMPAGPSEVLVYADESAIPQFVAADLLSQAEHGVDSQVVLVASSEKAAKKILKELDQQLAKLPRKEIAQKALENSVAVVMPNPDKAIDLINDYAPEHLIVSVRDEEEVVDRIHNAGSVFIGNFTPESAGDYASGTNHTLPTYGFAKNYSGVSLDSFVKKITYQKITEEGIKNLGPTVEIMAENELLQAHKNAVSIRLNYLKDAQ